MSDTTNPKDLYDTIREATGSLLIRGAEAVETLIAAQKAFDAGDVDKARLLVHNGCVGWDDAAVSVNILVSDCLPRGGDGPSPGGTMG